MAAEYKDMLTKLFGGRCPTGAVLGVGALGVLSLAVALGGCAAGNTAGGEKMSEGVVHQASDDDRARTKSTEPLEWDSALLWVNGLGCPQCSNNVDRQLKRISGVQDVRVDLSAGKVTVKFVPGRRPSAQRLSQAMDNAGVTLVKIEKGPDAGWVGAP
jgi:copper chaperone CopZ